MALGGNDFLAALVYLAGSAVFAVDFSYCDFADVFLGDFAGDVLSVYLYGIVYRHQGVVCGVATVEGDGLQAGAFFLQREGRTLRGVYGRGRQDDRNEFPA